jgi:hypothetical protein
VALSVAACGGSHSDPAVTTVLGANSSVADNAFTATLTGAQEVPSNAISALGAGTVIIDPNTRMLRATVVTAGIAGTAVRVEDLTTGLSGPIVFSLSEASPGIGIWATQVTLTDAQLNALRAGNYIFHVQNAANPTGDIRGRILPRLSTPPESGAGGTGSTAASTTGSTVFKNALTGTQVVPPASTAATAIGTAAVDHVAKSLTVAINTTGITGSDAHIHEAEPGRNGPVVFPLAQTSAGSGIWFAKVTLSDAQLSSLMAGNYYLDVHSAAFPNGEVRGQIAQLHRRTHLNDCRFGGFGLDNCSFDGVGLFIGFGFGFDGFGVNDFGTGDPAFIGFDAGNIGTPGFSNDGGPSASDTPAPGIFF